MLKTNKFNQKNITDGAVKLVSAVSGVMVGGALQNVVSMNENYGNVALTTAGGVTAILVDDKSTTGTVVKYMGLGLATRSLFEIIKGQFQSAIPQKGEGEELSMVDKLVRGAVGLSNPSDGARFLASPQTINFEDFAEVPPTRTTVGSGSSLLA